MIFEYVLTFNTTDPRFTSDQIHTFIVHSKSIESWYMPYAGTYLLKSRLATIHMQEMFDPLFNKGIYFLAYVMPKYCGGRLPPDAWTWLASEQDDFQALLS